MKKFLIFLVFVLSYNVASAQQFGEYRYNKYLAIQQQLNTQRMIALRNSRYPNLNATRNIRFPTSDNPYPNINRTPHYTVSRAQRYSPSYYQRNY